jgi:hypothetical protein
VEAIKLGTRIGFPKNYRPTVGDDVLWKYERKLATVIQ